MDRLAVIGVSHSRGGLAAAGSMRSAFSGPADVVRLGFPEAVVLATCNRFEVTVALPTGMSAARAREVLGGHGTSPAFVFTGEGALERLMRVAASLESLNPGEDQVMRQVRGAYAEARASNAAGPLTSFAFDNALRVAKRVRTQVRLAPAETSLFTLALPDLEAAVPPGGRVIVIGAGDMGAVVARALRRSAVAPEVIMVSRDERRGRAVAAGSGATWRSFDDLVANGEEAHAIVCATPAAALVDERLMRVMRGVGLIVDLGTPPNVAPDLDCGARVFGHEELEAAGRARRSAIVRAIAEAESIVREELDAVLDAWTDRQVGPAVRRLRSAFASTVGDSLDPAHREALAHRCAHLPLKGLRAIARRYGVEAAEEFVAAMEES